MKLVAIGVGVLALGGLAYFAWRAHQKGSAALVAVEQAQTVGPPGAPPGAEGGSPHVETIGPVAFDRTGRGHF